MRDNVVYDQGMFLRYVVKQSESEECGIIEMYDVTCGQCFREMRTTVNEGYEGLKQRVGFNSKFMALAERNDVLEYIYIYRLNIYDLEAVKNKKSCDNLLVFTLEESWDSLVMDESRILCHSFKEMNMLNSGSFSYSWNESKSVTLSLPWRSVWRNKGFDEEPLETVHHMKAYRLSCLVFHVFSYII